MKHKSYPAYRPSGVEWLGEVPEGWEVKRFSYEVAIREGQVDPEDERYADLPLIGPEHMESRTGKLGDLRSAREQGAESGKYYCSAGNVLYSKIRPALAKVAIAEHDCLCSADVYPLWPRKSLVSRYLFWLLLGPEFTAWSVLEADRVAMPKINRDTLNAYKLPLPPLPEQRAIATFLDSETARLEALLAKKRRLVELLKERRSAVITRAVTRGLDPAVPLKASGVEWLGKVPEGWEVSRLSHLTTRIGSGKTPTGGAEIYQSEGVLFLRSQNVFDHGLELDDVVFIDHDTDVEMEWSRVRPMDVLLNITGASLGRTCIYPDDGQPANVNQHVCVVRLSNVHLAAYVSLVMKSHYAKSCFDLVQTGSAREGLNFEQVGALKLPLPPLPEQRAIVAYLDRETAQIDTLVTKVEDAIEKLTEYRTALISAAVTGKIDVRDEA